MATQFRKELGPLFSEGARLVWVAFEERKLIPAEAAKLLGWRRGTFSRVVWGDRMPGIALIKDARRVFGVPPELWGEPLREPFIPPLLREEESEEEGAA